MSIFWLRAAVALYSAGLFYVLHFLLRRGTAFYKPALGAFSIAVVLHFVSLTERSLEIGQLAVQNSHQTVTVLAFLLAVAFLLVVRIYEFTGLALLAFPIIFVLTLIGATAEPFGAWPLPGLRDAWLLAHILLIVGGFAATLLMALASLFYLIQERHLKTKRPALLFQRLPPLYTLDQLASRAMTAGFILTTIGTLMGVVWAYMESGSRWIGEGKIHISLFTWAFYLAVVFLRTSGGWRGRRAAFLAFYVLLFSTLTWLSHGGLRPLLAK